MNEPFFILGLGAIERKKEIDKYDNKVSIITLPDMTKFRMVHHKSTGYVERATVYAGKDKFLRYTYQTSDNDCVATTLRVGNYSTSWGDGDCLGVDIDPNGPPELKEILHMPESVSFNGISYDAEDLFLMNILLHGSNYPIWQSKATEKKYPR